MYINELITRGTNLKKAVNEIIEFQKIRFVFDEIMSKCMCGDFSKFSPY
jgi:hypothetical protein